MTTNSENSVDQTISFERIKYFIYSQIDNTIFINSNVANIAASKWFCIGNNGCTFT